MLLVVAMLDLNPKMVVLTAAVAVVPSWAAIYTVFADTDAVSAVWGGIITLFITKIFDWLMLRENNRKLNALTDVIGTKPTPSSPTLVEKADTAANEAAKAKMAARKAVEKVDLNEKEAAKGRERVERHTNGEFAAMKVELAELRRFKEESLLQQTPPLVQETLADVANAVIHAAETSDAIADKLGASKSGTKLPRVKTRRDPDTRSRHDDTPSGEFKP